MSLLDKESPVYFVRKWRNVPEQDEAMLEDFIAWLEYDDESPVIGNVDLRLIKDLVDAYLGRNMKQIKKGESQLLDQWIKASQA
jgi:hypothetical protein